ncbi:MAG: CotH kinase family protein [Crocinitomicaceae bacterium]|nr:CotH kinase family protein [Crocinitomicaceae bacterium]
MFKRIDFKKLSLRLVLLVLVVLSVAIYFFNRQIKNYGYENAGDFVSNYWNNLDRKKNADPVAININISDADFEFLKGKREEALERGVQINIGDNYVDCAIEQNDFQSKGQIRLKGHMTDHLEGDKWSYRVKSDEPILGMYRFSLQHPGTRNYAYEWVYHQLLKKEEVIHLNYDFIDLSINNETKGIYAIEEHFGQHVLAHNDRPKGAILRWNPELYWENRIDELKRIYLDEEYSDYSTSFPEPYDQGVVKEDPYLVDTYIKGASLLEAFRRDSLSASQVFDLDKLARFHAIIDLVGGYHSLDWSDIKFYYNSRTERVEPVGYESFSVRKSEFIAGQRIPNASDVMDYHDKIFSDMEFFSLYIEHLERIASEEYFRSFMDEIQPELDQKLAILAIEWPYRKFSFDPYFENIELIRHNLQLPKPLHAFVNNITEDSIYLSLAPVSDFPIEIYKLEINDKEKLKMKNVYLPAKQRNTFAKYYPLAISNKYGEVKKLELFCRIPGSANKFKVEVNQYPSYKGEIQHVEQKDQTSIGDVHGVTFNKDENSFYFNTDQVCIDKVISIPVNSKLQFTHGQEVSFVKNGRIIVEGELDFYGDVDFPIVLQTDQPESVIIVQETGVLKVNHLFMDKANRVIDVFGGTCKLLNSTFADINDYVIHSYKGDVVVNNFNGGSLHSLGKFERSMVYIEDLTANHGDTLLFSVGSDIKIRTCKVNGFDEFANLDRISQLLCWNGSIDKLETVIELNNSSEMKFISSVITNSKLGFKVDLNTALPGSSSYQLYKSEMKVNNLVKT